MLATGHDLESLPNKLARKPLGREYGKEERKITGASSIEPKRSQQDSVRLASPRGGLLASPLNLGGELRLRRQDRRPVNVRKLQIEIRFGQAVIVDPLPREREGKN